MEPDRAVREMTLLTMEIAMLYLCATGTLAMKVFQTVRDPYMDEIFHVPQAQKYCDGHYSHWDPMITTLPGLYISSLAVAKPLNWIFDVSMKLSCSVLWLRSINVVYMLGNLLMMLLITHRLNRGNKNFNSGKALFNALVLSIFPVLYFFSFLYYTDPGSTFFVLTMYLISLYEWHLFAALIGIVAIFFRQTNVVWVVFIAGLAVSKCIRNNLYLEKKEFTEEQLGEPEFLLTIIKLLLSMLKTNKKAFLLLVKDVIITCFPYLTVGAGFVAFVVWNGSIVVGAKDDHPAGIHIPQLFYFAAFTCAFSFMHVISLTSVRNFLKFILKHPFIVISFCALCGLAVWKFTIVHRYLLADNRHYPFYIWSKVYARHNLVRYALIPGYFFAWWSILNALGSKDILWKAVYILTVTINLLPMTLLELRYFIIPYLIFRLNIRQPSYMKLLLEACVYVTINAATLYLFLYKPFQWPANSSAQRFMW